MLTAAGAARGAVAPPPTRAGAAGMELSPSRRSTSSGSPVITSATAVLSMLEMISSSTTPCSMPPKSRTRRVYCNVASASPPRSEARKPLRKLVCISTSTSRCAVCSVSSHAISPACSASGLSPRNDGTPLPSSPTSASSDPTLVTALGSLPLVASALPFGDAAPPMPSLRRSRLAMPSGMLTASGAPCATNLSYSMRACRCVSRSPARRRSRTLSASMEVKVPRERPSPGIDVPVLGPEGAG
mmetsp:Transcript_87801/g.244473  ORF Transcript_87801/g.244473 Transcript_87801/m.244473 type:complete len:243 (+) Transcript_87801:574-1302(+)